MRLTHVQFRDPVRKPGQPYGAYLSVTFFAAIDKLGCEDYEIRADLETGLVAVVKAGDEVLVPWDQVTWCRRDTSPKPLAAVAGGKR